MIRSINFANNITGKEAKFMKNIYIYGAKSTALGICKAIEKLYSDCCCIRGFLVSSWENNPLTLAELPVIELEKFTDKEASILIATPENLHNEIICKLEENGFYNYVSIDSKEESKLMERYFHKIAKFPIIHRPIPKLEVYVAKFYKDQKLKYIRKFPDWFTPIQVGTVLTEERIAESFDNSGENISEKNVNYCELTALYWIWKNRLLQNFDIDYYGLFHYRRILDIKEEDLYKLLEKDIDVILPLPTLHEPDISEHHSRYIKEEDWNVMLQALEELQPDYASNFSKIFSQQYFYNYNIILAKKSVLLDYCEWLFPILERVEALSIPKGWERADRYIGYLGENLMTLYFFSNQKNLKIYHTGRLMLT